MHNLILVLKKLATLFEFLLLEAVAFFIIYVGEKYKSKVILSSCNAVVARVFKAQNSVFGYFGLRKENDVLAEKNAFLLSELEKNRLALASLQQKLDTFPMQTPDYQFVSAKVLHNSVSNFQNFIVIDKGEKQGVSPEMGVLSSAGVVGVVRSVSENFATVISVLNTRLKISCRMQRGATLGSLVWEGKSSRFAQLEDVPRHVQPQIGDTIVTSGFSTIFPEGCVVGTVESYELSPNAANYEIKVKLASDFSTLKYVKVLNINNKEELNQVISEIEN